LRLIVPILFASLARKPTKPVQGIDVENRNHIANGVDVFLSMASIKGLFSRVSLDVIGSGARHVRFRHSYDFAMSSYILRNRLRIIGG
jgi:hypothetical protein